MGRASELRLGSAATVALKLCLRRALFPALPAMALDAGCNRHRSLVSLECLFPTKHAVRDTLKRGRLARLNKDTPKQI